MRTRPLGKGNLDLPELSLGTWGLASQAYGPVNDEDFAATIEAALDAGIYAIDLSPLWGESESRVAKVIGPRRDKVLYLTRTGMHLEEGRLAPRFDPKSLVRDCEASLRRLETDRIDLWLLHNAAEDILGAHEYLAVMNQLREEGKIRAWGASVGTSVEARMAISAGAEAICLPYNLLHSADVGDVTRELEISDCGLLARSPLMYGLLGNRWNEREEFAENDHRRSRWGPVSLRQRVRQTRSLRFLADADKDEATLLAGALRFVLNNPRVTSALVGPRTAAQVGELVTAIDQEMPYLTDAQSLRIEQVLAAIGA